MCDAVMHDVKICELDFRIVSTYRWSVWAAVLPKMGWQGRVVVGCLCSNV